MPPDWDLPHDIFLKICEFFSDWRDVISLRGVCQSWNFFLKSREVWAYLVSSFLDQPSSPKLHYIERPISCYSAEDLEQLYKRWRMAEKAWKTPGDHETNVQKLDLDPGCLARASILAPGGRWLIVFTNLIRAFCFDLDSRSPGPVAIIPAQIESKAHYLPEGADLTSDELVNQIFVEVSEPEVDPTAENLSFRVVVTYGARYINSTVQVWQFDAVFNDATGQSSLDALRVFSWSPTYGYLRCRSFLGNVVALEAPDMDVGPGLPVNASKFLIFSWRSAKENPSNFPLRTLFTYKSVDHVQLLRDDYVVLYSLDEGLVLYDYASIQDYTGPRTWGRIMNLYPKIKKLLSLDFYGLMSKPYYIESEPEESDTESGAPAGSLILFNNDGHLHEMDIEAEIDIRTTRMKPVWYLGSVSISREDLETEGDAKIRGKEAPDGTQICLGYSHAACIAQGFLKLITYWRGPVDEGELIMKETGIPASEDARLQMDEGSGRIVVSEPKQNCITIVDLAA